jgi:hypothetical protein
VNTHATPAPAAALGGPILAASLWRDVIEHARERCECQGECGRKHTEGRGRCLRMNNLPFAPLHAVPRDGGAPSRAAAMGVSALFALCDPCHAAAAASRSAARRAATGALSAAETLF